MGTLLLYCKSCAILRVEVSHYCAGLGDKADSSQEQWRQLRLTVERFVAAVKSNKHHMRAARRQLKALLQDARWFPATPNHVQ